MSEQDTTSTQSLPVDDAKPNATQRQTGGDNAAGDVAQGNGFGATSDLSTTLPMPGLQTLRIPFPT